MRMGPTPSVPSTIGPKPPATAAAPNWHLARIPAKWNHFAEEDSRQINMLEQILIAKVCNFGGICSKTDAASRHEWPSAAETDPRNGTEPPRGRRVSGIEATWLVVYSPTAFELALNA